MNLGETLLSWYSKEGRTLPWREEITPYKVWLSEIIMQQTRVAQGLPYFNKFIEKLPTVAEFAAADQDYILNLWQGLGYYSRARNMHAAANQVMDDFDGKFPATFEELKQLKGVGDYTAAAIASIAFGQSKAVVDGNVYRVLARLFDVEIPIDTGKGKRYFQQLADELIVATSPGDYNQAIMDFGAMVCTPKSPNCEICPLSKSCEGLAKGTITQRPIKSKKIKVTDRFFEYFEICTQDQLVIEQRSGNDIWKGLFQLPLVEVKSAQNKGIENVKSLLKATNLNVEKIAEKKHILSHQRLHTTFYRVKLDKVTPLSSNYQWIRRKDITKFAFPKLISNYLKD